MTILDNTSTYIQAHKRAYRKSADHTVKDHTGQYRTTHDQPFETIQDHTRPYIPIQDHTEPN